MLSSFVSVGSDSRFRRCCTNCHILADRLANFMSMSSMRTGCWEFSMIEVDAVAMLYMVNEFLLIGSSLCLSSQISSPLQSYSANVDGGGKWSSSIVRMWDCPRSILRHAPALYKNAASLKCQHVLTRRISSHTYFADLRSPCSLVERSLLVDLDMLCSCRKSGLREEHLQACVTIKQPVIEVLFPGTCQLKVTSAR